MGHFAMILACPRHVRLGGNLGHDAAVQLIDTSVVRVLQARRASAAAERQKNLEVPRCGSGPLGLLICPSGGLLKGLSSLFSDFPKNILVPTHPKSHLKLFASRPTRGAYRDRHGRWAWDAVDAAAFCARRDRGAGWRKACERSPSERTRDVAAYGEVVWS
jgi:hypothetical protein